MRHITITLLFLALCLGAVAQKPIRHPSTTTTTPSKPAKRTGTSTNSNHRRNTPMAIDLGLSVKWASCNLGTSKPEGYGSYYAWGMTKPLEKQDEAKVGKYTKGSTLNPADDAAMVKLGGKWRMPTKEEMDELKNKCKHKWTKVNGVNGCRFTGPNGKSIFIPAAGYYVDGSYIFVGIDGSCWSATNDGGVAYCLGFGPDYLDVSTSVSYNGYPIRPVLDK